jgi:FMN phosphatase YigB (HAD superfamily)
MAGQTAPSMPSALGCVLHSWDHYDVRLSTLSQPITPRGLILDLDDTLYPREHYVQSGLMAVARFLETQHAIPAMDAFVVMSAARREGYAGYEFQAVCSRFSLPAVMIPELLQVFRDHRPLLRMPRTTAATLASLKAAGWQLAILTNGLPSVQRLKIESLGLPGFVRHIVYAEEHAEGGKPSPGAFREALRRLSVPKGRVVMAGDDPACDIAGARSVGLKTVRLALPGVRVKAGADADAVIDSLDMLPRVAADLLETVSLNAA